MLEIPTHLPLPKKVKHVACSGFSSFVICEDGSVLFWGSSLQQSKKYSKATRLKLPGRALAIACGWYHALVVLENGDLYAWGENGDGKLGLGDQAARETPTKVPLEGVVKVNCGGHQSLAITKEGMKKREEGGTREGGGRAGRRERRRKVGI
jgi:alpha-tubulin suppressor-like RCC1 family protein